MKLGFITFVLLFGGFILTMGGVGTIENVQDTYGFVVGTATAVAGLIAMASGVILLDLIGDSHE